ncbi:MAG: OmpA family protein [Crocinitomicaceae bacterium]|nr:OmpA family protein [Crocinitomicaceae bacterium]
MLDKNIEGSTYTITGHTDNIGDSNYNKRLSKKRSKSMYYYLITYGIHASYIMHESYGESNPVGPNDYDKNRSLNRRVELIRTDPIRNISSGGTSISILAVESPTSKGGPPI